MDSTKACGIDLIPHSSGLSLNFSKLSKFLTFRENECDFYFENMTAALYIWCCSLQCYISHLNATGYILHLTAVFMMLQGLMFGML